MTARTSNNTATEDEIVLGSEVEGSGGRRSTVVLVVALLAVALVWRVASWELDYFAFSPGSATATTDLVVIEGAESFPPDGELFFTTVSSRRVTVVEWVAAHFDPAVDLVSADSVLGGRTQTERREQNLQAMMSSQEVSEIVALERLGYDVVELTGALIAGVAEGSAAEGLLEVGDVVVGVDGVPITTQSELVDAIGEREPGEVVELEVRTTSTALEALTGDVENGDGTGADPPAGETELVEVELGESEEGGPLLGVSVTSDWRRADDLGIEIEIEAGEVGGPSAGLAWTLTILDLLSEGELTGGAEIAITGTMELDGSVGPIGGITQKTYAVREQGIDVFIVPLGDEATAEAAAGDDLEVIGVETLDDALDALTDLGGDPLPEGLPEPAEAGS